MKENASLKLKELLATLENLPCWYVSCGGAAGSSFQLALGDKVPRSVPVKNTAHPQEYRLNEGQANLLVWCSWRLDGPDGPLASSDSSSAIIARYLGQLIGATLLSCVSISPAWDLLATFDNDCALPIFCDQVGEEGEEATFDGNWELWLQDLAAFVGINSRLEWETRPKEVEASS